MKRQQQQLLACTVQTKHAWKVEPGDRNKIMLSFKDLVYESNINAFDEKYLVLAEENDIIQKFLKYIKYNKWVNHGVQHTANIFTQSFNTNNVAESQFMTIKDRIFTEWRNIIHFPCSKSWPMSRASITRINYSLLQVDPLIISHPRLQFMEKGIESLGNHIYKIPSETVPNLSYVVDTFMCVCECKIDSTGVPCKHQFVICSTQKSCKP